MTFPLKNNKKVIIVFLSLQLAVLLDYDYGQGLPIPGPPIIIPWEPPALDLP